MINKLILTGWLLCGTVVLSTNILAVDNPGKSTATATNNLLTNGDFETNIEGYRFVVTHDGAVAPKWLTEEQLAWEPNGVDGSKGCLKVTMLSAKQLYPWCNGLVIPAININDHEKIRLSFYAKGAKGGEKLSLRQVWATAPIVEKPDGSVFRAGDDLLTLESEWKKYDLYVRSGEIVFSLVGTEGVCVEWVFFIDNMVAAITSKTNTETVP